MPEDIIVGKTDAPTIEQAKTDDAPKPNNDAKLGQVTLTQEQLDKIINERLERQVKSFLKKAGVESIDDLEARNEQSKKDREELAFVKNNIDVNRYDDVKTHFKGLGKELNSNDLGELVKTHPEWVKTEQKNEVKDVGISKTQDKDDTNDDVDYVNKLFGTNIRRK